MMLLSELLDVYLCGSFCDMYITVMDEEGDYKSDFISGLSDIINMKPIQYNDAMNERRSRISKYENMVVKMFYINDDILDVTLVKEGL